MFELDGKTYLTTTEAAERLGVTDSRIRHMIRAGRLTSQQFGRDHLIREADLALVSDRKPGRPKKADEAEKVEATRVFAPVKATKKRATKKARG
jgi:excisionase family DNA binding protein